MPLLLSSAYETLLVFRSDGTTSDFDFSTIIDSTFDNCTTIPYTLVKSERAGDADSMLVCWAERNVMQENGQTLPRFWRFYTHLEDTYLCSTFCRYSLY